MNVNGSKLHIADNCMCNILYVCIAIILYAELKNIVLDISLASWKILVF